MFHELLNRTKDDIGVVRSVLQCNEQLRTLLFGDADAVTEPHQQFLTALLGASLPDSTKWKVLDHSAGITRLYAVYEGCVRSAIRSWLGIIPTLYPSYGTLDPTFRSAHRRGIAKLLQNLERARFKNLTEAEATKGFYDAVSGAQTYELQPDAFLFTERNFRKEALEEVFASVAIQDAWKWVHNSRFVKEFLERVGRGTTTPEAELRQFVGYRNDAAHGNVDQVLGIGTMMEIADFVESLCLALCELVTWTVLRRRLERGESSELGEVTEKFRNGAVVAVMKPTEVATGDEVYVCGASCCVSVRITSIQMNDASHDQITVADQTELGFMFDAAVPKNHKLCRW